MMNHWYDTMGAGDWLIMSVFWIALIGAIVWAIAHLSRPSGAPTSDSRSERPDEILDRRLASGEIDSATYDALRSKLHPST